MTKVSIPLDAKVRISRLARALRTGGWESASGGWQSARLIVPASPRKNERRRRPQLRAVAPWGLADIGITVWLDRSYANAMVKVHCARRYGPGSGQVWSIGSERPLPTVLQAQDLLQTRLVRRSRDGTEA